MYATSYVGVKAVHVTSFACVIRTSKCLSLYNSIGMILEGIQYIEP